MTATEQREHVTATSATSEGTAAPRRETGLAWLTQVLVVLAALGGWELLARSGLVSREALPGPVESLTRLVELLGTAEVWTAIGQTLTAWGIGMVVATIIAVPLGIGLGLSSLAYRSSRFVVDFLRTIPALGLIPLAALVFGASQAAVLVIVIPSCVWPLLLQTTYGVRDADPVARETARSFRLGTWQTLRRVILPGALPFVATGLRLGAVLGMLLTVSIELLVLVPGIGALLAAAQRNGNSVDVYALTVLTGFLGLAVVLVFTWFERWVIRWHPSVRSRP